MCYSLCTLPSFNAYIHSRMLLLCVSSLSVESIAKVNGRNIKFILFWNKITHKSRSNKCGFVFATHYVKFLPQCCWTILKYTLPCIMSSVSKPITVKEQMVSTFRYILVAKITGSFGFVVTCSVTFQTAL